MCVAKGVSLTAVWNAAKSFASTASWRAVNPSRWFPPRPNPNHFSLFCTWVDAFDVLGSAAFVSVFVSIAHAKTATAVMLRKVSVLFMSIKKS